MTSIVLPFLLPFVLILLAVFLLYNSASALDRVTPETSRETFWNVLAYSLLLAGATACARILRLTRDWLWRLGGAGTFLLGAVCFAWLLTPVEEGWWSSIFYSFPEYARSPVSCLSFVGLPASLVFAQG